MENIEHLNIKVLKFHQQLFTWAQIRWIEPIKEFFKSPVNFYFLFNVVSFLVIASAVHLYKNTIAFILVIQVFQQIVGGSQCTGMCINIGINMEKIKLLHKKLQEIVDEGEHSDSINFENLIKDFQMLKYSF